VVKGANPLTEHYSAVQAEVPDAADPHTLVNKALVRSLEEAEQVAVAGEAASHCVANTVRDLAVQSGDKALVARLVLLEDATSPVPGFEKQYEDFRSELAGRGMRISNTREFLA
jgi:nicotinamidase-related amidase